VYNLKFDFMNVIERAKAPTLALLTVSGAIVTAPVALPAAIVMVAGYVAVAGSVLSAVSQITVDDKTFLKDAEKPVLNGN
jgi:hypothetical protein